MMMHAISKYVRIHSKDHNGVVSAGGRLTTNASPPGWTPRSVAEQEQLSVMIRGKW